MISFSGTTFHLEWHLQQGIRDDPGATRRSRQTDRRRDRFGKMVGLCSHSLRSAIGLQGLSSHSGKA